MEAITRELDFEKGGGLVTAIAQDAASGEVLMVAHMNPESFRKTVETGEVHYWSRSRNKLWYKGEESGNVQRVQGIYVDCDGDVVLLKVQQVGDAACHTGRRSCFFRKVEGDGFADVGVQVFDPAEVYGR
jgi:phosphoribosyl-AMP cyclohydrolase